MSSFGYPDAKTCTPIFPSPPSSPNLDFYDDLPVVATNEFGMVVDDVQQQSAIPVKGKTRRQKQDVTVIRKKREPRKYVSKHFTQAKPSTKRKLKGNDHGTRSDESNGINEERCISSSNELDVQQAETKMEQPQSPSQTPPPQPEPRICYGLNLDELSSDSELTDVPSDIDTRPDPFLTSTTRTKPIPKKPRTKKHPLKSPYFPHAHTHRPRATFIGTTLPFPPLSHARFGLMQERLAHDPYRLLLATIFLNKTPGERAMPIFFELMRAYPTPLDLSRAQVADVTEIIRTLGFQNQRARKCVEMAKVWVANPPTPEKRYRKLNYPCKGDGKDVKEGETVDRDDERVAWEISHLPGLGPYSHDSWRMFCRDETKGLAEDWLGTGSGTEGFEPEWKRVLPADKELRAWMTWMWLKEGWVWNKETGQKTEADQELLRMAREGGVVQEEKEKDHLTIKGVKQETVLDKAVVEQPAGDFMP